MRGKRLRGNGSGPERVRETVTPHGRGVRGYMDVFTACLPDPAPARDLPAAHSSP
jgi:hypothetical protein